MGGFSPQIFNLLVYKSLRYASPDEHCAILNLKIGGGQSIECSRINQVKENLPISYATFPCTLNKTFDHANFVYSPHLLYYIQGYIPASHKTKHMAVLYVICMTSLFPLVMQRDVLHPMVLVGVKLLVAQIG